MLFRRSSWRTTCTPFRVRLTTSGCGVGAAVIFLGGTTGGLVVSACEKRSVGAHRSAPTLNNFERHWRLAVLGRLLAACADFGLNCRPLAENSQPPAQFLPEVRLGL